MGVAIDINVKNENEFNQQLQMYLAQGYQIQSNFNGTAILIKKDINKALLIILLICGIILGVIYYLVASDNVVTITNNNKESTLSNQNTEKFTSYCSNCGHGLFKDSKFCPGCGEKLTETNEEISEEMIDVETDVLKCKNCGAELSEEQEFCSSCGEELKE